MNAKRAMVLAALALAVWFAVAVGHGPVATANEGFRAGAAKVDITPPVDQMPVPLNGYADRGGAAATGVLDPVYAHALVLVDGAGRRVALVSADLCFINSEVHDDVVARLAPYGFTEHNVLLEATHTHSGPAGYDRRWLAATLEGAFDEAILKQVTDGLVQAVVEANAAVRPASLEIGTSPLPEMNRSRRDPAFDVDHGGASRAMDRVKYPTDERLTLLRVVGADEKPIALVVHFASHATVLSPQSMMVSADWPGAMTAQIDRTLGGGVSMFINGALGDAAPVPDWSDPALEIAAMREYGTQMAEAVLASLPAARPVADPLVAGFTSRIDLGQMIARPLGRMPVHPGLAKTMLLRKDQPFQAVRIGPLVLLAAPSEPTTLTGRYLETLCKEGFHCLTVGPANGYLGYFVMPEEYEENLYAADSCFFGKDAAAKLREALRPAAQVVQSGP